MIYNVIFQKKRRFRQDNTNPYRTRYMTYKLVEENGHYFIEVEQEDYVLNSIVASTMHCTPELPNEKTARQLVEHMLDKVRSIIDAKNIYENWQSGKIVLIQENKNVLVKEAIRKRFARNLKKI